MTAQYLVPGDAEEEGVHQGEGEQEPGDAGTHGGDWRLLLLIPVMGGGTQRGGSLFI